MQSTNTTHLLLYLGSAAILEEGNENAYSQRDESDHGVR